MESLVTRRMTRAVAKKEILPNVIGSLNSPRAMRKRDKKMTIREENNKEENIEAEDGDEDYLPAAKSKGNTKRKKNSKEKKKNSQAVVTSSLQDSTSFESVNSSAIIVNAESDEKLIEIPKYESDSDPKPCTAKKPKRSKARRVAYDDDDDDDDVELPPEPKSKSVHASSLAQDEDDYFELPSDNSGSDFEPAVVKISHKSSITSKTKPKGAKKGKSVISPSLNLTANEAPTSIAPSTSLPVSRAACSPNPKLGWFDSGGSMSLNTAKKEYGLNDQILAAARKAGKLKHRNAKFRWGNRLTLVLTHQVKAIRQALDSYECRNFSKKNQVNYKAKYDEAAAALAEVKKKRSKIHSEMKRIELATRKFLLKD